MIAVYDIKFELLNACSLCLFAGRAGSLEEGGVLVHEAAEELIETMLRAEKVELVISSFFLGKGRHERAAVLGDE